MLEIETLSRKEKQNALDRALASNTFARSDQLRCFLRYVCEAEFRGATGDLTEYVIGTEVLHRPEGYSPTEDSAVRTRAYELRQKLEKLYASELSSDAVQIKIPKGHYIPQFVRLAAESLREGKPERQSPAPRGAAAPRRVFRFVLSLVIVFFLGAFLALWIEGRSAKGKGVDPVIAQAWAPFAKPNDDVLLVPSTPLYLVLGPATHGAYGSPTYPAPQAAYPLFRQHRPLAPGAQLGMIFTDDATGVGNLDAVVTTSRILHRLGVDSEILPERHDMMSLLHDRDTVLFGAPVDSEVISQILADTPLSVVYDEGVREFVVRDRLHRKVLVPKKNANGQFLTVYGLVTVLNDRESSQGREGMIVFSGITSVGTYGAAEYFTSPQALESLLAKFKRKGISGFPPAYQVVVKCKFQNMLLVSDAFQSLQILKAQ